MSDSNEPTMNQAADISRTVAPTTQTSSDTARIAATATAAIVDAAGRPPAANVVHIAGEARDQPGIADEARAMAPSIGPRPISIGPNRGEPTDPLAAIFGSRAKGR